MPSDASIYGLIRQPQPIPLRDPDEMALRRMQLMNAERAGRILTEAGYDAATVERVGALLQKKHLRSDAEAQTLEDAACLVFLENHFAEFSKRYEPDKIIDILRKTWAKMSPNGHKAALELVGTLPGDARQLVEDALA